jgi:hypothetical protein
MRNALPLVVFSLFLAGCTSTRINPHPLRQVMAEYRSIEKGMTEEQVVALLGTPDRIDQTGMLHWWQDLSPGPNSTDYVELDVSVDGEGRVLTTAVRSGDEHYADSVRDRDAPLDPRGIGTYTVFRP